MSIDGNSPQIQWTGKYQTDVNAAAQSLEHADGAHIQVIMDQINGHLKNNPGAQGFMQDVNGQIGADGKRAQVESVVGQLPAVHDIFSSQEHIKDPDLLGKIDLLNGANRFVQARVAQDLLEDRGSIEDAKREHQFLFFGKKDGIDDKRLGKFADNEDEHNKSELVLTAVGPGTPTFNALATRPSEDGKERYFTKDDLDQAIASSTDDQQRAALTHVREKFKAMSQTVVIGHDSNDDPITARGITDKSITKYLTKQGATAEIMDSEAQSREAFQQGLAAKAAKIDAAPPAPDAVVTNAQLETSRQSTLAAERSERDQERDIATQVRQRGEHKAVDGDTWIKLVQDAQTLDPTWCSGLTLSQKVQHLRETNSYDKIMAGRGTYKHGHDLQWKDLLIKGSSYKLFNDDELQQQTNDSIKQLRLQAEKSAQQ